MVINDTLLDLLKIYSETPPDDVNGPLLLLFKLTILIPTLKLRMILVYLQMIQNFLRVKYFFTIYSRLYLKIAINKKLDLNSIN